MTCRWNGRENPRVLPNRHEPDCVSEACRGCLPCTEAHCRVCGITHDTGACPGCLDEARDTLAEIGRLWRDLDGECVVKGVESEAMHLAGPVADPEAWRQRGRYGHRYDLEARLGENHPLWVLGTWEMLYREELDHVTHERVTIAGSAGYLDLQLTYLAGYADVPFEDFARDLRSCRAHLEAVLHDGEQRDTGAPCLSCGVPLERVWGEVEKKDGWRCPRCKRTSTEAQYRFAVAHEFLTNSDKLTADQFELAHNIPASTIRRWASRRKELVDGLWTEIGPALKPVGRAENGRLVYSVAEALTLRENGGKMPGFARASDIVSIEGAS